MPRQFQFSLKTLLWLMLCIACFFAGMRCDRMFARRKGYFHVEESEYGPIVVPVE